MKTKIKNLVTSALLGVAVLGGAALMQSFKEAYADLTWYFTGDDPSEITDASKWSDTNPGLSGCSPTEEALPCELNTPTSVNSSTLLQLYFQNQYQNDANNIMEDVDLFRKL